MPYCYCTLGTLHEKTQQIYQPGSVFKIHVVYLLTNYLTLNDLICDWSKSFPTTDINEIGL